MDEITQLAGILLIDAKGRIAMQLRDDNPDIINPGKWSVFGGHIEPGEDPDQAALREAYEELTITLKPEKLDFLGQYPYNNRNFFIFRYMVTDEMDDAELREGQAWRWCTLDELSSLEIEGRPVTDYHLEFLQRLFKDNG